MSLSTKMANVRMKNQDLADVRTDPKDSDNCYQVKKYHSFMQRHSIGSRVSAPASRHGSIGSQRPQPQELNRDLDHVKTAGKKHEGSVKGESNLRIWQERGQYLDQMVNQMVQAPNQAENSKQGANFISKNLLTSLKNRQNGMQSSITQTKVSRIPSPVNLNLEAQAPSEYSLQELLKQHPHLSPQSQQASIQTKKSRQKDAAKSFHDMQEPSHLSIIKQPSNPSNQVAIEGFGDLMGRYTPYTAARDCQNKSGGGHHRPNKEVHHIPNPDQTPSVLDHQQDLAFMDQSELQIIYSPPAGSKEGTNTRLQLEDYSQKKSRPEIWQQRAHDQIIDSKKCKSKLQERTKQLRARQAQLEAKFENITAGFDQPNWLLSASQLDPPKDRTNHYLTNSTMANTQQFTRLLSPISADTGQPPRLEIFTPHNNHQGVGIYHLPSKQMQNYNDSAIRISNQQLGNGKKRKKQSQLSAGSKAQVNAAAATSSNVAQRYRQQQSSLADGAMMITSVTKQAREANKKMSRNAGNLPNNNELYCTNDIDQSLQLSDYKLLTMAPDVSFVGQTTETRGANNISGQGSVRMNLKSSVGTKEIENSIIRNLQSLSSQALAEGMQEHPTAGIGTVTNSPKERTKSDIRSNVEVKMTEMSKEPIVDPTESAQYPASQENNSVERAERIPSNPSGEIPKQQLLKKRSIPLNVNKRRSNATNPEDTLAQSTKIPEITLAIQKYDQMSLDKLQDNAGNRRSHRVEEMVKIDNIISIDENAVSNVEQQHEVASWPKQLGRPSPRKHRQSAIKSSISKKTGKSSAEFSGDADEGDDDIVVTGIETGEFQSGNKSSKYFNNRPQSKVRLSKQISQKNLEHRTNQTVPISTLKCTTQGEVSRQNSSIVNAHESGSVAGNQRDKAIEIPVAGTEQHQKGTYSQPTYIQQIDEQALQEHSVWRSMNIRSTFKVNKNSYKKYKLERRHQNPRPVPLRIMSNPGGGAFSPKSALSNISRQHPNTTMNKSSSNLASPVQRANRRRNIRIKSIKKQQGIQNCHTQKSQVTHVSQDRLVESSKGKMQQVMLQKQAHRFEAVMYPPNPYHIANDIKYSKHASNFCLRADLKGAAKEFQEELQKTGKLGRDSGCIHRHTSAKLDSPTLFNKASKGTNFRPATGIDATHRRINKKSSHVISKKAGISVSERMDIGSEMGSQGGRVFQLGVDGYSNLIQTNQPTTEPVSLMRQDRAIGADTDEGIQAPTLMSSADFSSNAGQSAFVSYNVRMPAYQSVPLSNLVISKATKNAVSPSRVVWQEAPTVNLGHELPSTFVSTTKRNVISAQNSRGPCGFRQSYKKAKNQGASIENKGIFLVNQQFKVHPDRHHAIKSFLRRFQNKIPTAQMSAEDDQRFKWFNKEKIGLMQDDTLNSQKKAITTTVEQTISVADVTKREDSAKKQLKKYENLFDQIALQMQAGGDQIPNVNRQDQIQTLEADFNHQILNSGHVAGLVNDSSKEETGGDAQITKTQDSYLQPVALPSTHQLSPDNSKQSHLITPKQQDHFIQISSETAVLKPTTKLPINTENFVQVTQEDEQVQVSSRRRLQLDCNKTTKNIFKTYHHQKIGGNNRPQRIPISQSPAVIKHDDESPMVINHNHDPNSQMAHYEDYDNHPIESIFRLEQTESLPKTQMRSMINDSQVAQQLLPLSVQNQSSCEQDGRNNSQVNQEKSEVFGSKNVVNRVSIFNSEHEKEGASENQSQYNSPPRMSPSPVSNIENKGQFSPWRNSTHQSAHQELSTKKIKKEMLSRSTVVVGENQKQSLNQDLKHMEMADKNANDTKSSPHRRGQGAHKSQAKIDRQSKVSIITKQISNNANNKSSSRRAKTHFDLKNRGGVFNSSQIDFDSQKTPFDNNNYNVLIVSQDQFDLLQKTKKSQANTVHNRSMTRNTKPIKLSNTNIPSYYAEGKNKLPRPRPLKSDGSYEISSFDDDTHRSDHVQKRHSNNFSQNLGYPTDVEGQTQSPQIVSQNRKNSQIGNISVIMNNHQNGTQNSTIEVMHLNSPDITLDDALSHAALPCSSEMIERNMEHVKYKTKVMVDASTGIATSTPITNGTTELLIVSDDFYATQFFSAFHQRNITIMRRRPEDILAYDPLGKYSMRVKTFEMPIPAPSHPQSDQKVKSNLPFHSLSSGDGRIHKPQTSTTKNTLSPGRKPSAWKDKSQTGPTSGAGGDLPSHVHYQKGMQRPKTSENRNHFPRARRRPLVMMQPVNKSQQGQQKNQNQGNNQNNHRPVIAGAQPNSRYGHQSQEVPEAKSTLIKIIEQNHQLIPLQQFEFEKLPRWTPVNTTIINEGSFEDCKSSNKNYQRFSKLSNGKRSTLSPSYRHHKRYFSEDMNQDILQEAEICVDSIQDGMPMHGDTEAVQIEDTNDDETNPFEQHEKWIMQTEANLRVYKKDTDKLSSVNNSQLKQRSVERQEKAHPYLRHLKVQTKKLQSMMIPHYYFHHDPQLGHKFSDSYKLVESQLFSNNDTYEVSSPMSPCLMRSDPNSPPTMMRETPEHSRHQRSQYYEGENRTVISKLSPDKKKDETLNNKASSDEKTQNQGESSKRMRMGRSSTLKSRVNDKNSAATPSIKLNNKSTSQMSIRQMERSNIAQIKKDTEISLQDQELREIQVEGQSISKESYTQAIKSNSSTSPNIVISPKRTKVNHSNQEMIQENKCRTLVKRKTTKTIEGMSQQTKSPPASVLLTAKFNSIRGSSLQKSIALQRPVRQGGSSNNGDHLIVNGHLELKIPDGRNSAQQNLDLRFAMTQPANEGPHFPNSSKISRREKAIQPERMIKVDTKNVPSASGLPKERTVRERTDLSMTQINQGSKQTD